MEYSRQVVSLAVLCATASAGMASTAHAGSLNAWGLAMGSQSAAIMPFVQTSPGEQFGQVYAASGLGERADLNVGVGTALASGSTETTVEFLPRVFVLPSVGLGVHAYVPASGAEVVVGPEVHTEWSRGAAVLAGNVGWTPVISAAGGQPGEIWAVLAPEVYLADQLSIFMEVDPVVDLAAGGTSVTFVPGVGVLADPEGNHSGSLGVGITPGEQVGVSVGLAWTSMWTLGARRATPVASAPEPADIQVAAASAE